MCVQRDEKGKSFRLKRRNDRKGEGRQRSDERPTEDTTAPFLSFSLSQTDGKGRKDVICTALHTLY